MAANTVNKSEQELLFQLSCENIFERGQFSDKK